MGVQVNFPVYLANMFKTMRGDSLELVEKLIKEGTPNAFKSVPVASCKDWSHLQAFDYRTLLCTQGMKVSCNVWKKAVEAVSEGVSNLPELLVSLKETERRVAPTTHAAALLMPTQKLLKSILEDDPTVTARDLAARVKSRSLFFKDFYLGGVKTASGYTLEEALDLYEEFHILEAVNPRWSKYHMFKCNCPCCFKNASCAHVLLASMVCDKRIEVPIQYVDASLQYRRRGKGRPTARGKGRTSEEQAQAELTCRERASLDSRRKTYRVPTVRQYIY